VTAPGTHSLSVGIGSRLNSSADLTVCPGVEHLTSMCKALGSTPSTIKLNGSGGLGRGWGKLKGLCSKGWGVLGE
jgi:hypothetical protein